MSRSASPADDQPRHIRRTPARSGKRRANLCRPLTTLTRMPSTSWTARLSYAGHGDGHKKMQISARIKHKTTGMNLQVACTIYSESSPGFPIRSTGTRHDNYCREAPPVLLTMNPGNWIGDKKGRYIGNNMITPFRKPAGAASYSTGRRNTTPRLTRYDG